ncbi:hypothetical protein ABG067_001365 [Albugo candida]
MAALNLQGWSPDAITKTLIQLVEKQQELLEAMTKREIKVEGISLPQFHGKMGESVDLYFEQLAQQLPHASADD